MRRYCVVLRWLIVKCSPLALTDWNFEMKTDRDSQLNFPLWTQIFLKTSIWRIYGTQWKQSTNFWKFLVSGFAENGVMIKVCRIVVILNLKQQQRQKLEQWQGFMVSCVTLDVQQPQ